MRPIVVYWNNIPAPYMVERFNALADRGKLDFEAWFNDKIAPDRSWVVDETMWRFPYRYIPTTRFLGHTQHWPLPLLGRRPDVMVSLYAEPTFFFGWLLATLRGVKTGFRVLMTFDRWVQRHPVKEAVKRFLFKRVDFVETVGKDGMQFAMRYGTLAERIFFATHTIDISSFEACAVEGGRKHDELRKELGLKGCCFIYVGRLWWGKGIHYLLRAFEHVQRQSAEEVSLLLVGDGPEETKLKQACTERRIRNVVFAGFMQKPELPRFYAAADVFVFPTLGDPYGLVVDEAMACSLPIISTSAAGEIKERVEEGVNGFIVPPEDSRALAERMLELARNPELRVRMGQISAKKIKGHTPEKWAADFEEAIYRILGK